MAAPKKPNTRSRTLLRWMVLIPVLYVVSINVLVRRFGGDANLCSVRRLSEKSGALSRLALHSIRHLWSNACDDTAPYVREAARAEGIPVSFALAIARTESGFRSHVISSTGAMGVMQLMPATAARHGVWDPFNPEDNARGAARYISTLWRRYHGNRMRVAAAYNAGEGAVPRSGQMRVPSSTLSYASTVVKHAKRVGRETGEVRVVPSLTSPLVITASNR